MCFINACIIRYFGIAHTDLFDSDIERTLNNEAYIFSSNYHQRAHIFLIVIMKHAQYSCLNFDREIKQ